MLELYFIIVLNTLLNLVTFSGHQMDFKWSLLKLLCNLELFKIYNNDVALFFASDLND